MKKVIVEKVNEEAKYYCDKHPDKECYSELKLISWYGSQFDLNCVKVHLCDECVKEMYDYLEKEFNVKPVETDMSFSGY